MQLDYRIPNKISGQNHIPDIFRIPNTDPEKQELTQTDQKTCLEPFAVNHPPPPNHPH